MMGTHKVFISYSHDSPEHMQWVSELATRLRRDGVNIILDQWALGTDDDVTQFMKHGIKNSDRILVICTDSYVRKANTGKVGIGDDESIIVTRRIVEDKGINKFIPIIRQTEWEDETPTFLSERVYIDFTDDNQFDAKFNELLHERLLVPSLQRPYVPHIESLRVKNYRAATGYRIKTTQTIVCLFRRERQWEINVV